LPIKELASGVGERNTLPTVFSSVRPRLTQLLLSALQIESDSLNTQILLGIYSSKKALVYTVSLIIKYLLGGLASLIHDLAAFEQSEHNTVSLASHHNYPPTPIQNDSASNVMSSTSDTHSCHSTSSNSYPSVSEITLDSHLEQDAISFSGPLLTFPLGKKSQNFLSYCND
jgi:hypothetical protein